MGHFVCAFCVRKFFKILNSASADLQYENLKLASTMESVSSNILSLKEIQSDREEQEQCKETKNLAKKLDTEIPCKAVQIS